MEAVETIGQLSHIMQRDHRRAPGQSSLRGIFRRDKQPPDPSPLGSQGHRQHTGNRADLPFQTHLAQKGAVVLWPLNFSGGGHNADEDGQVIVGAALFEIGGRQVHRDPSCGKPEPAAPGCRPDPLPGLFHRRIRQTYHIKAGHAV